MSTDATQQEDRPMSGIGDRSKIDELVQRMDRLEEEKEELQGELERERERRKKLEGIIEFRGVDDVSKADLSNIWIAGNPVGKIVADNKVQRKRSEALLFGVTGGMNDPPKPSDVNDTMESETSVYESIRAGDSGTGKDRDLPFPLYRMLADMQDGHDAGLNIGQKRAARLFERFVNKVKGVRGSQNVTTDRDQFVMTTEQAIGVLEDEGLLDVKPQSKSKIAGRVMREVQRFTIVETDAHEECDCIDGCFDHGVVQFRSGKPHTLTVRKGAMEGVVINASASDKDVRTADDGESGGNSPEDSSVEAEMERLTEGVQVTSDD